MKWCKFYNNNLLVVLESKHIEMCFDNRYKYRTLHGGCYEIIKKIKQAKNKKQKFFERLYWVVFQFLLQKYYI